MSYLPLGSIIYITALTFILGMVFGSFINCMSWRIANNEDFVHGRSHCTTCGHQLSPKDLIPVISWVSTKGTCRYCGEKVSIRYPFTEIIMGVAFVAILFKYDISYTTLQYLILIIILLAISLVDLDTFIIPNSMIIAGILNRIVFIIINDQSFKLSIISSICIAVPMLLLVLIMDKVLKKESMGGGDIKLFAMIFLYFNWKFNLFIVLLSCILGIIFGLIFNSTKKNGPDSLSAFPFGPSISLSTFISLFIAEKLINMYLSLF